MYDIILYHEDENAKVTLENKDGYMFVHVAIYHASKKLMKQLNDIWLEIKNKCYWLGYEHIYTYTKEKRMMKFFPGSTVLGEFVYNHEQYEVLQWELN